MTKDGICPLCGEMTDSFCANPGKWAVRFSPPGSEGVTQAHHVKCVTERVYPKDNAYKEDEFWQKYRVYFRETLNDHKSILGHFPALKPSSGFSVVENVLDLGCGKLFSARELLSPRFYVGVDEIVDPVETSDFRLVRGNYRDIELLNSIRFHPWVITSLFSSELGASPEENDKFYKQLLDTFQYSAYVLVSGFYYSDRRDLPIVKEAEGLVSHQSIGDLSTDLDEVRVLKRVPSKMFGADVVEVWRLLSRKNRWE